MQVVFVMDLEGSRVASVHWQDGDKFVGKALMGDGSLVDDNYDNATHLSDVAREGAGGHGQSYVAEVDDVRSALKYLGKSPDLVQMLPRVDVWKDAPRRETEDDQERLDRYIRNIK